MDSETLAYLKSLRPSLIKPGLARIRALLHALGDPQESFPSVLIGGTNGKGSVASMMASIVRASGRSTGLYLSPHIRDVRERIRWNGRMISKRDFYSILLRLRGLPEAREATYFEVLTASAFLYFARKKVDLAIVEVGLGGRFDATNILNPWVSVLTNVELEHTRWLGKTREAIARDKADIARKKRPLVGFSPHPSIRRIFAQCARRKGARWVDVFAKSACKEQGKKLLDLQVGRKRYTGLRLPLFGEHQRENLRTALTALGELPWRFSDEAVRRGLAQVRFPGRLQVLQKAPFVLLDGAHNPAAMRALTHYLDGLPQSPKILVMALCKDKDLDGIFRALKSSIDAVVATQTHEPRLLRAKELSEAVRRAGLPCMGARTRPEEAMRLALQKAGKRGMVCAAGSFFLADAVLSAFKST